MGNIADHIAAAIAIPGSINDKLIGFFAGAVRYGSGAPEGVVTAPVGAIYIRSDGGAGTSFYVKESGSGNTGWKAPITAAASSGVTNKFIRNTTATLNALNSGVKAALSGTVFDITLAAVVGDVIEAGLSGQWSNDSVAGQGVLDIATIVSGSVVHFLGGTNTTFGGMMGTYMPADTGTRHPFSDSARIVLQSGDISGGNVLLRAYYSVTGGGNKIITVGADSPVCMWAKNLGPQAP
jgi:hypothetical protein